MDRVFGYEPKGQGFESLAAHHRNGIPVGVPFLFFGEKVVLMCCKGFEPERDEPVKKTCRWHVFRARGRSGYAARPADAQAAAKSLAAHHRNGIPVGMPFLFFNDILHWKDTSACSRVHGTRSAGTVGYTVFCHTRVL